MFKKLIFACLILCLAFACANENAATSSNDSSDSEEAVQTESETTDETADLEEKIDMEAAKASKYFISQTSFFGISIGDYISSITENIEKAILQDGEGNFDVYNIKSEKGKMLGYFYPDTQNPDKVGQIVIMTKEAYTEEKIKVGMTFKELQDVISNFEVHGSETESRTHVFYKDLMFRLDFYSSEYDLDLAKIPADAKITKIMITG